MKKSVIIFLILQLVAIHLSAQTSIYVSKKGADSASGSKQHPLQTINKALEKALVIDDKTIAIVLREGRYDIEKTIEINHPEWKAKHIIIKAYENERVSITGGRNIPLSKAKKITDKQTAGRIQKEHLDKIRVIDLSKENLSLADLIPVGFSRPSLPAWTELFVNEQPMHLSRWPNDSTVLIGKVHNRGNIPREEIYDRGGAVFEYNETRPANWLQASQVWISGYFAAGYAEDMIRIAKIDTAAKTITTKDNTIYGFQSGASFRRWYAVNLLEEIDSPGEYVIEADAGKIYFYPPVEKISQLDISLLQDPIIAVENTGNVCFENITFEYSRGIGIYMENTENVIVKGCTFRNLGSIAVCIGRGAGDKADEELYGKSSTRVLGDINGRFYKNILYNRNGGRNNGVKDCYIYNVGAGGVSLGGGDRTSLTPAGNYVENCRIHDYNRVNRSYHGAINMDGVGNRISNCEIFNAPSMAILFKGNNHLIEYCDIYNVCTEVDDQGAIYYGRDVSERGNIIRYCYFHDFPSQHRVSATYHDDGACGSLVEGCVYYKAGSMPVLIGGGHDHHYVNNIFIESPIAIHIDNRMQGWGVGMIAKDGVIDKRLQEVQFQKPPYAVQYPELVNYWNENPAVPKRNYFTRNLFYKIGDVLAGKTSWGEFNNNWITTVDEPGFVDNTNPLKGFKANANIYNMISNFEKIPFEKIGCTLPVVSK